MIDPDELKICQQRGHNTEISLGAQWVPCRWCGMWLREVRTIEERPDEPPADQQNPLLKLSRR